MATSAAVLWHVVVGCCAHHGHAADEIHANCKSHDEKVERCCDGWVHKHAAPTDDGGCHGAGEPGNVMSEDSRQEPGSPCDDSGGCSEWKCAFVVSESEGADLVDGVGCFTDAPDMVLWPMTNGWAISIVTVCHGQLWANFCAQDLRRHLALGVLQI